ncbi:MAG TPA: hypothetical protein VF730_01485 [Terracidiphilus sp.]
MLHPPSWKVEVLLLDTLQKVEKEPETSPDDPALRKLKRSIVRLMAELHVTRSAVADLHSANEGLANVSNPSRDYSRAA